MPYVERSIVIAGPIASVYELAKNMEAYPDFMPDVESVKIVEKDEGSAVTEWETNVDGTPILWTERDVFDDVNHTITYQLLEGDLEKFEGMWRFEATDEGTRVTLSVDFDFGIPELTGLIGPTLEQKVGENSDMMLQGMKQKIESA